MNFLAELRARFTKALQPYCDDPAPFIGMVKAAQDSRFGDYQANCVMPLAKQTGRNPRELAQELISRLDVADLCETPTVAGPGFINLKLRSDALQTATNSLRQDDRLGIVPTNRRRIVIDYSSPNVAKPMHVGHLRSSVIGDALCRMLRFLGHEVISDNHIGDWGTQFGMIIYGYKHFLNPAAYAADPVGELARLYRLVNQLSDYHDSRLELVRLEPQAEPLRARQQDLLSITVLANPDPVLKKAQEDRSRELKRIDAQLNGLREEINSIKKKIAAVETDPALLSLAQAHPRIAQLAREETARLHAGDAENRALWEQFMPPCLAMMETVYQRLGIQFDRTLGESFYQPMLADVVDDLLTRGLATESDGAICVFLPGNEAPFIVRKRDGAFTYATTDLATIRYRVEQFQADAMLYVVDARQSEHFKLLFETARRWNYPSQEFRHVSFGTVLGEDKKPLKTRSGDNIGLKSLLDEAVERARAVLEENDRRHEDDPLDEAERQRIAETVGLGAVKYADLCQNRESDYVFSWEKMLATSGDSGTYMQYAYARVNGIFRRGQLDRDTVSQAANAIELTEPAERLLALQLNRFSEALELAAAELRPNFLTAYLFETANAFSTFFEQCPVLKAETEALKLSRLQLADLTARVIAQGLELLGIQIAERM